MADNVPVFVYATPCHWHDRGDLTANTMCGEVMRYGKRRECCICERAVYVDLGGEFKQELRPARIQSAHFAYGD